MIDVVTFPQNLGACIRVIGVGGGGGNAINNMIRRGLTGVEYIAANTDIQALEKNLAPIKIQIGKSITRGLGAGSNPEIGRKAVEENLDEIHSAIDGSDMVFITAGMGGGTGTGAAPIIAKVAKESGALVVGIVTKPFVWEARKRITVAEEGIKEMRKFVDALIVIPNQRLLEIIDPNTPLMEAFLKVDEVLYNATRGIVEIISDVGYINVDFADVRTIMSNTGDALMGIGRAKGDNRAIEAAQQAISSPLLDGISINGARGLLINVTGDETLTMQEVSDAISFIEESAGEEVNLIYGVVLDESLKESGELSITVIATGFNTAEEESQKQQNFPQIHEIPATNHMQQEHQSPRQITVTPKNPPRGSEQLQQYDIPAYLRRQQHESTAEFTERKADKEKEILERPAFLRNILD